MKVEQISVFLENKAGRLVEVTSALANAGINLRALSLADTSDFGILRLIVADHEKTKQVLKEKGFTVGCTTVLAVEVPDSPGGLDSILRTLADSSINVEYMYAYVQPGGKNAVLIFRFDKTDQAIDVLQQKGFTILTGDALYNA